MIQNYETELSELIPDAVDLIPEDFDYKKNIAIEIKIGEGIKDNNYRNDITLQIRVVGAYNKKYKIINKTMDIDKLVNQKKLSDGSWIVREDIWYTSYLDKEKFNTVLMYKIRNYK